MVINFNLNKFLLCVSSVLDFTVMSILGVNSNHSKRVAYISLNIAKNLGLSQEEIFDIISLAILHDNGMSQDSLHSKLRGNDNERMKHLENFKEHCIIGEENIKNYPFLTDVSNVIKYHHEHYDGTGFFGKSRSEIPQMSQIIALADTIDIRFNLKELNEENKNEILYFLNEQRNKMFCDELVDSYYNVSKNISFSLDLKDEFIDKALKRNTPNFTKEYSFREIRDLTQILAKIIDCKSKFTKAHSSGLAQRTAIMCDYYNKSEEEKMKLLIAADLHDIGKLAVPNYILDKKGKLDKEEFNIIKGHTYYTRICLESIDEFEDITEWASNHHEKLDGSGYPYGKSFKDLDFNSRLMGCLDIYQALIEERPYRESLPHYKCIKILESMGKENLIDKYIVNDIDNAFKIYEDISKAI